MPVSAPGWGWGCGGIPLLAVDLPRFRRCGDLFSVCLLRYTTFGMVVRAGMHDRDMVGLLGINVQRSFTIVFGVAAVVSGLAGVMYTPILPPTTI